MNEWIWAYRALVFRRRRNESAEERIYRRGRGRGQRKQTPFLLYRDFPDGFEVKGRPNVCIPHKPSGILAAVVSLNLEQKTKWSPYMSVALHKGQVGASAKTTFT
ncbi:hypothetical protein TNCV_4057601 [Trichonephila clavipes]|nr:hypothetical protein TNCV_4057601 [Trichonephila clavipes]